MTTTQYLTSYGGYTGTFVKVTDPAGKWKVQRSDGLGNLIRVFEPDPSGGADLITNYTYNALGQLTDVSMPRNGVTQTRHFVYTGTDLTSATNPENGTTTYVYGIGHQLTKRTDAKGQETRYFYDVQGRLTQVQHWTGSPLTEDTRQRVNYYYDSNPIRLDEDNLQVPLDTDGSIGGFGSAGLFGGVHRAQQVGPVPRLQSGALPEKSGLARSCDVVPWFGRGGGPVREL